MANIEEIVNTVYTHDQTFDKPTIRQMIETVERKAGLNSLITRYSSSAPTLVSAWENLKKFFGPDGRPKAWFYPEMNREVSSKLVMKSVYEQMSRAQKDSYNTPEVKAMLEPYEGQVKYFLVRHCVVRPTLFTVVRLEIGRHIGFSRHWFGINYHGKFQAVDMDSDLDIYTGHAYDTADEYLVANFSNININVSNFAHSTRNYNNLDKQYDI